MIFNEFKKVYIFLVIIFFTVSCSNNSEVPTIEASLGDTTNLVKNIDSTNIYIDNAVKSITEIEQDENEKICEKKLKNVKNFKDFLDNYFSRMSYTSEVTNSIGEPILKYNDKSISNQIIWKYEDFIICFEIGMDNQLIVSSVSGECSKYINVTSCMFCENEHVRELSREIFHVLSNRIIPM